MSDNAAVPEAIHFCSVPTYQLPALVEHGVIVDTGQIEFGRRITGRLLSAERRGEEVVGTLEMDVRVRTRSLPSFVGGGYEHRKVTTGFALRIGDRAVAHLRSSVLASVEGAYDIEDTWAHERADADARRVLSVMTRIREDATLEFADPRRSA
ncbi:hypothetical protein [Cellulosimicrobium sp. Marseille-Q4280]|uniref:hypothetical protein n=1 Tax=Cellulosimicrobium sp. Marseille-Q4280 TaxID=2937992 RepID=UPI00203BA3DE|nr:hypothetical protein [Cellulosimicrobium sp. Marseille-Q4280]